METVEELCDDIALINKSQKILEGKKKEIKILLTFNEYITAIERADKNKEDFK
jgi:ABC-2 type transport system ATP-binding protein